MSDCWIQTHHGTRFDLLDPEPCMVHLDDICVALSRLCRFTGHTNRFYSVAEHSINGMHRIKGGPLLRLEFLLHDAHEAYVGDVNGPLKSCLPEYRKIEHRIDQVIRKRFNLPLELSPEVKEVDLRMLATERRRVMPYRAEPWACLEGVKPYDLMLVDNPTQDAVKDSFRSAILLAFWEASKELGVPAIPND